jgi:5-hydroxyisourate hydrolase
MSTISSHILDTSRGRPASGVPVFLFRQSNEGWTELGRKNTNADGRVTDLLSPDLQLGAGMYKLKFETGHYFHLIAVQTFYPFIEIVFEITRDEHYHVPLLLNAFGFSTYRGS